MLSTTRVHLLRWMGAAVAAWLLCTGAAFAQSSTTGSLQGVVYDDSDLELPGAEVTISSDRLIGGSQTQTTGLDGRFRFGSLLPGEYKLRVQHPAFTPVTVSGITVLINRTTTYNVTMSIEAEIEEVEVNDPGPQIDTESASVGTVLTKDFLQRIPSGRSYQDAVQLSAGVSGGANPNMAGGASNENTYLLDGAEVTDPVTGTFSMNFNYDAIQQIEVILGGYDAEYGTSLGGIINIVTESGTNNLEFDTSVFYQNGDWRNARKDARYTRDGRILGVSGFEDTLTLLQFASRVSGPLVQDKAWFIFSYQYTKSIQALSGIPQARTFDGHYLLAKLTVQPNSAHRIAFLFQADPTIVDNVNQADPFQRAEAQTGVDQASVLAQATWQWFINQDMNLETRVQAQRSSLNAHGVPCTHDRSRDWHQCRPGEEEGDIDYFTPARVAVTGAFDSGNTPSFVFDDRWRVQGSVKYAVVGIQDPAGGSHDIKVGISTNQTISDSVIGLHGDRYYFDTNLAFGAPESYLNFYAIEGSGAFRSRQTGSTWSAFVQDAYKPVSNFTIRYGLRYDNTTLRDDLGRPVIRGNLFGPRVFVAWDPWGDQKTKIAGGYGRFNETGRQQLASFTSVGNFGLKIYRGEIFAGGVGSQGVGYLNGQTQLDDFVPRQNLATASPNLQLPAVDEFDLIIQRQIIPDFAFKFNFQGRFVRNLYAADETNLIYDSDGSAIIGARLADPINQYLRLRTPRLAGRNYYRMDFELEKRFARRWFGRFTYSFTWTNGTAGQSLGGAFRNDPQSQFAYGQILTDRRHAVNAILLYDVPTDPWTLRLSATFDYESGQPLERLYFSDVETSGSGPGFRLRVRNRNAYTRFNDFWELNLGIQQAIDVRRGQLFLIVFLQNVTNNRAPTNFSNQFYPDNRLYAVSRQAPFRMTLGARYEF